jgi:uncharacterized damage-inducible protein DinB
MRSTDLIDDAFGRIRDLVHRTVDGLTPEQLAFRADHDANSIGWLTWHLTRIQDDHIADVAGEQQAWTSGGWADRFGLPFDAADTGYGHGPDDVAAVAVESAQLLLDYYDAVHSRTVAYIQGLSDDELDRVVDTNWDPPVTLGVRLMSVIGDDWQHVGQAAFIRGVVERA